MKKTHFWFTILALWLCCHTNLFAQNIEVSGKVTSSDDGQGVPAVNVLIKGTGTGTVTDVEGNYRLKTSPNAILVFSFIGFIKQEVNIGNQSVVNVVLKTDVKQLEEVVITSFGVAKEKKELGYSVQELKGLELAETNRPNMVNSLQGRIAGINVGTTGGSPGSSSSIVIRGGTSIGGNNQPLFVIDGIPVDNSTLNESLLLNDAPNRGNDYTNRIADIDPNDIESLTVLKGPAAAALYGIDAANGAIIITTKKGKKGSMKIDYVANFMLEKITRFPNVQDKYGLGSKGIASQTGLQYWGAESPAGATKFDNLDKFYGYGLTNNQSVSISGGSDNITYLASANIFRQNGSMPGTGYDKNTFRLNLGAKLSEKLNFTASVSYLNTETRRPPATKGLGSSFYYATIWPRTDDMSNWENSPFKGTVDVPVTGGDDLDPFDNPYFSVNKNKIKDVTDRLMLNGSLSYDPTSWLNLTARVGLDRYQTNGSSLYDAGSYYRYHNKSIAFNVKGVFAEYTSQNQIINAFFLATFKKKAGDWNGNLTLGYNVDSRENRVDSRYGEGFLVPDLPSISNTNRNSRDQATRGTRRNLFGVFGELKIDYKNYLFFNFTGRNDWSSTLPKANNNFFYPSASVSFVASEALNLDKSGKLSFLKLRVAVAQVGKDAPPHQILPALQEFTRTGGGYNLGFFGPNDNIKPETTTSYEAGLDLRFFNNRLALDVTYYRVRSKNQIVQPRLSYASGYILQLVNSGEIENQGIEALLTAKAYMGEKFSWDVIANFTLNRNKVISLPGDFTEFYLSDSWLAGAARGGYIAGSPYSSITGNSFKRDANGQMLIGDNGYPIRDTRYLEIGNRQPNFTLGITNVFRYKDFMLSALLDIRSGGDVFNGTDWALTALGLSQRTLDRGKAMTFEGIVEKTGEKNTKEVILDQDYYTGVSGAGRIEETFIEKSVNWLRLRDISLSYTLPKAILEKTKIVKNLSINFTGNNLWLWTNYTGADPDVNGLNAAARGSGAVGFDYFSVASPKTYSLGLKATF